jgi:hypothetical protein
METEYLKVSVSGAISYHDTRANDYSKYERHYETKPVEGKDKIFDLSPMDSVPVHNIENLLRVLTGNRPRGLRVKKEMSKEAYNASFVEIVEIAELAKKALVSIESGIYANKNGLTYSNEWRIKRSYQLGDEKFPCRENAEGKKSTHLSVFEITNFEWSEFNWKRVEEMAGEYIGNLAIALNKLAGIERKELRNYHPIVLFKKAFNANAELKQQVVNELFPNVREFPDAFSNLVLKGETSLGKEKTDVSMKAADKVCKRDMTLYIPISKNVKNMLKKKYATFLDSGVAEVIGFVKDYEVPRDAKPAFLANNQQQEKA